MSQLSPGNVQTNIEGRLRLKATMVNQRFPRVEILKNVEKAQQDALQALMPEVKAVIRKVLGTQYYSYTQLKQMGHPYARRFDPMVGTRGKDGKKIKSNGYAHSATMLNPGIINYQPNGSGTLYDSIRWEDPTNRVIDGQGRLLWQAFVYDDKADRYLIGGTKYMVPRPYPEYIRQLLNANLMNRLTNELRRALRIYFDKTN